MHSYRETRFCIIFLCEETCIVCCTVC